MTRHVARIAPLVILALVLGNCLARAQEAATKAAQASVESWLAAVEP
jgi:hypothetical protein